MKSPLLSMKVKCFEPDALKHSICNELQGGAGTKLKVKSSQDRSYECNWENKELDLCV